MHTYLLHTGVVSWHVEIMAALIPGELCGNVKGKENGGKFCVCYYFQAKLFIVRSMTFLSLELLRVLFYSSACRHPVYPTRGIWDQFKALNCLFIVFVQEVMGFLDLFNSVFNLANISHIRRIKHLKFIEKKFIGLSWNYSAKEGFSKFMHLST